MNILVHEGLALLGAEDHRMDVAAWLCGLGLEQYTPAFRANDVDGEVLPELTADDLIGLGVTSIGHRRKLLAAIAALGTEPPTGAQSATSATSASTAAPTIDAERRQLTVMFCDLVGSTALSTRRDPEDLRELIGDYHRAVAETVGRFDGFVAKYMGDGVLIYFGYPQAHEDDAERAVRAGLAVIEAVGQLPAREDLRVRLGIATGLAVVGDLIGEGAAQERGVVGETPNLAARVQALAAPNTLVIAEATRRQVGGLFDLADLGPQAFAGFAEPQPAWRVIGESGMLSRFEALRSGTTPLVGRDEEVELLFRRWQQAKTGEGRVVLISGEPGIGKSRLTAALSEQIGSELHTRLRYFCSPHHQDSALYPFIAQLERASGFARDDAIEARLGKLRALLAPGAQDDGDIALLSEMLSLPSSAAGLTLSPQRKREKLFEALLGQLEAEARRRPVLMVFEDAHWIDPTSRELLDLTVDRVRHLPVLLAITFRPEFQPPWGGRSHVTSLALNRLGERDGEALVQKLVGNTALTPDIVVEIVERTDGVPLFVEELTKAVLESAVRGDRVTAVLGTASLAALSVPATLHASLMARLDRLGPIPKEIAQIGAVLGREFAYELIEPVAQCPERELQAALDQLGDAGLLFCRGTAPHASYLFKHALVQDAAYSTLLRGRRQELHGRVAAALEANFSDTIATQPELLAHHFAEAGLAERAIQYLMEAGRRALQGSAMAEAAALLRRGLALAPSLPEGIGRQERELDLQIALSQALIPTQGFADPAVGEACARARQLCEELGSLDKLLSILYGQWAHHSVTDLGLAGKLAAEIRHFGELQDDNVAHVMSCRASGLTHLFLGDFKTARACLEDGLARYYIAQRPSYLSVYATTDPLIFFQSYLSVALVCSGHFGRARSCSNSVLAYARSLSHAHSLVFALHWSWVERQCARSEPAALLLLADELLTLSDERSYVMWRAHGLAIRGWCLAALGRPDEGVPLLDAGLAEVRASAKLHVPYFLTLFADAYRIAAQPVVALSHVTEAEQLAEATHARWLQAETLRLRGNLLLITGDRTAAESSYRNAIELARTQGAKLFELRATASLAGLWRGEGRRAEAREILTPVYGWFTEGFDTADLREAKALLDELT